MNLLRGKISKLILILIGLSVSSTLVWGLIHEKSETETIKFEVILNNNKIGKLVLEESKKDSINSYTLTSAVKLKFPISIKIEEKISERYKNKKLISSQHFRIVNGNYQANNHLIFTKNQYKTIDSLSNKTGIIKTAINWSVLLVYFNEPKKVSKLYSHNYRKMLKISTKGNQIYHLHLPNGKVSKFYYKNNKLLKVEASAVYGTLKFNRI